jgi:hypothetical protein
MSPPWVGAAGKSRHRSQRGSRLPPKDVEEGGLDCTDPSLEGAEARGVTRGGYDTMVSQWVRTADRTDASADSRGAPWSPGEITSAGRGNGSGRLTGLGRAVGKPHAPHGHVRQRDDGEAGHAGRIARFGRYTGVASLAARQAEANRRGFPRFRFPHAVGEAWETRGGKRYRAGGEVAGGVRRTRPCVTRSARIPQSVAVRIRHARRSSATVSGAVASASARSTRSCYGRGAGW